MALEALFQAASYAVLPFWLLLIAAPRWRWTQRLVHGPVVLLLLAPIYGYMLLGYAPTPEGTTLRTLFGVMIGFTAPHLVLAGWIHYLIFDLFIGAWQTRDAARRGIAHLWVILCLLATLMAGPLGLLLYVVVRFFSVQALEYDETGNQ